MTDGWPARLSGSGPPVLVYGIGALLALAAGITALDATGIVTTVEAAIVGILALAVLARGLTLQASDRTGSDQWRIAAWCLVGTLAGGVLSGVVLLRAALRGTAIAEPLGLAVVLAGIGAVTGLFVGGDQVRAIQAGRTSVRRETSELLERREAERLTFLNNLLRHNVLNGMNIVLGYTATLEDRLDGPDEDVERIRTRSEAVVDLVQNVQVLVRSLSGDLTVDAVDLTQTTRVQADRARRSHDATIHTDLENGVVVATTPFIASAIENLLTNAATHNTTDHPEIALTVEHRGEQGIVSVSDNGPGIPQDVVDTYFGELDPNDDFVGDGLGLYLVDELVTTHGGTIDVDTSQDGTTITLEFPIATEYAPNNDEATNPTATQ